MPLKTIGFSAGNLLPGWNRLPGYCSVGILSPVQTSCSISPRVVLWPGAGHCPAISATLEPSCPVAYLPGRYPVVSSGQVMGKQSMWGLWGQNVMNVSLHGKGFPL